MGNINSCVGHLRGVRSVWIGGAREVDHVGGVRSASEDGCCVSAVDVQFRATRTVGDSDLVAVIMAASKRDMEQQVETSKSHWSEVSEFASDSSDKEVEDENWEVWKGLYSNQAWVEAFFRTFGYGFEGWENNGSLEIGEKFAEGGQAELFHANIVWTNPRANEQDKRAKCEWVVKVFKKGTPLKHLQSQWPHGMLQHCVDQYQNWKVIPRFYCAVLFGTMLKDGRFAFLMPKEDFDLRTLIDHNMKTSTNKNYGPFSKGEVEEYMFAVALGMSWLHSRDIVHRDLKASNVLMRVLKNGYIACFVADYECSIGVVGTGLFRAPEILKACEDKSVNNMPELFTKSSDVYNYAMTCYEMLSGKLPFDGHLVNHHSKSVINGERPEVPRCVDAWMDRLLRECWQTNPLARPSFEDVVNTIFDNSPWIRGLVEDGAYDIGKMDWIVWRSLAMNA